MANTDPRPEVAARHAAEREYKAILAQSILEGRKLQTTEQKRRAVCYLIKAGLPIAYSMQAVGYSYQSGGHLFRSWMHSDPEVKELMRKDAQVRATLYSDKAVGALETILEANIKSKPGVARRAAQDILRISKVMEEKGQAAINAQNVQINIFEGISTQEILEKTDELARQARGAASGRTNQDGSGGAGEAKEDKADRLLQAESSAEADPQQPQEEPAGDRREQDGQERGGSGGHRDDVGGDSPDQETSEA